MIEMFLISLPKNLIIKLFYKINYLKLKFKIFFYIIIKNTIFIYLQNLKFFITLILVFVHYHHL